MQHLKPNGTNENERELLEIIANAEDPERTILFAIKVARVLSSAYVKEYAEVMAEPTKNGDRAVMESITDEFLKRIECTEERESRKA